MLNKFIIWRNFTIDKSFKYNLILSNKKHINFLNDSNNLNNFYDVHYNLFSIYKTIKGTSKIKEYDVYINKYATRVKFKILFEKINSSFPIILDNLSNEIIELNKNLNYNKYDNFDKRLYEISKVLKGLYFYEELILKQKLININYNFAILILEYMKIFNDHDKDYFNKMISVVLNNFNTIEYFFIINNKYNIKNLKELSISMNNLFLYIFKNKTKFIEMSFIMRNYWGRIYFKISSDFSNLIKNNLLLLLKNSKSVEIDIQYINQFLESFALLNKSYLTKNTFQVNNENIFYISKDIFFNNIINILLNKDSKINFRYLGNLIFNLKLNNCSPKELIMVKKLYNKYLELYINDYFEKDDRMFSNYWKSGFHKNFIDHRNIIKIFDKLKKIVDFNIENNINDDIYYKINLIFLEIYKINLNYIDYNKNTIKKLFLFYLDDNKKLFNNNIDKLWDIFYNLNINNISYFNDIRLKLANNINNLIQKNEYFVSLNILLKYLKFISNCSEKIESNLIEVLYKKIKKENFHSYDRFFIYIKFVFILERISNKVDKNYKNKWNSINSEFTKEIQSIDIKTILKDLQLKNDNQDSKVNSYNFIEKINTLVEFMRIDVDNFDYISYDNSIQSLAIEKNYNFLQELLENQKMLDEYLYYDKSMVILLSLIKNLIRMRKSIFKENKFQIKLNSIIIEFILKSKEIDIVFFKLFEIIMGLNLTMDDYNKVINKILQLEKDKKFIKEYLIDCISIIYKFQFEDDNLNNSLDKLIQKNYTEVKSIKDITNWNILTINIIYRNNLDIIDFILGVNFNLLNKINNSQIQNINIHYISNFNLKIKNLIHYINEKLPNIKKLQNFIKLNDYFNSSAKNSNIDHSQISKRINYFNSVFQNEIGSILKNYNFKFQTEKVVEGYLIDFKLDNGTLIETIGSLHFLGKTGKENVLLKFKVDFLKMKNYKVIKLYSHEFYDHYNKVNYVLSKLKEVN